MIPIVSDNKKVKKILESILKLLTEHGAAFDQDIEIHCKNDALSIRSPKNRKTRPMLRILHDLLPPAEDFNIIIKNDRFIMKASDSKLSAVQQQIMQLMLDLYNETNQLENFKKSSPWIKYKDEPAILNLFFSIREGKDIQEIEDLIKKPDSDDRLLKQTFFKTRLLKCALNKEFRKQKAVFMPIADAVNHMAGGSGYNQIYGADHGVLAMGCFMPDETDECFANYGWMDALDTYLHYAFIDQHAPFVKSIPMNIELENIGRLKIRGAGAHIEEESLPEGLKDLQIYMPSMMHHKTYKEIELSHIYIPDERAIMSLRRILQHAIRALSPDISDQNLMQAIETAESEIIKNNSSFYEKMAAVGADNKAEDISDLAALQHQRLEHYTSKIHDVFQAVKR